MTKQPHTVGQRIDSVMDRASKALVHRRYFEAERHCVESLEAAFMAHDYERMARILMPLQEARRQKRDMAVDAGIVHLIDNELPPAEAIEPGLYLVQPPRVGLDGRTLREMADRQEVPVVIVVREPTTRAGLCPIVALGPVTVRTRITPPEALIRETEVVGAGVRTGVAAVAKPACRTAGSKRKAVQAGPAVPSIEWMLWACEQLGDSAIAQINPARNPVQRVEDLLLRLQAVPDHEKLHQRLAEACAEAAALPEPELRLRQRRDDGDEGDEEADGLDENDDL